MEPIMFFAIAWLLLPLILSILWLRAHRAKKRSEKLATEARMIADSLSEKYAPITSVETEMAALRQKAVDLQRALDDTRTIYSEKRAILKKLEQQIAVYDERLSFAELGVYEPHFEFNDSEGYKQEIIRIRDRQKAMVSNKTSTHCPTDCQVDGSRTKGQTMIRADCV